MLKVPTSMHGELEVRYCRLPDGKDVLRVPSCTKTLEEWNENPTGPPPILSERDISTTTEWGGYMRRAMIADIEDARKREDEKFNYKPPTAAQSKEPEEVKKPAKSAKPEKRKPGRPAKAQPVAEPARADDIPPAPAPLSPGLASFIDPSTLGAAGPRPIAPRGRK